MPNIVTISQALAPLSSGFWVVTKKDIDLSTAAIANGASPHGFMVVYHPGSKPNAALVLYQTITPPSGAVDAYPHVDNTPSPYQAPKTGDRLPPAMTPRGDVANSYIDSPTWGNAVLPGTFKITAVAASRSNGKDTHLEFHYFEWSNRNRTISKESDDNRQQWKEAMAHWYGVPGY